MAGRLADRTAIVTGGGAGFGEGIARRFAAEGAAVAVADVNAADGERVAAAIREAGGRALFVHADVTREADMNRLVETARAELGGLHVMVSNAGTPQRAGRMEEVDEADFDRIFAVNVKSIFWAAKACVPLFKAQKGGCFIHTSSTGADTPRPGATWYCGSKGAVSTLTQAMAIELAPHRIRVNAICPVAGETQMLPQFVGGEVTPEIRKRFLAGIPLGRFTTPLDVGNAAVFLASDEADFITGVNLPVDGGRQI